MPYSSPSDVSSYCSNLIQGAANFNDSTLPTISQVNAWLSSGCAVINARLSAAGYAAPASGTDAYGALADLNTLYAAARAEMARTNVRLSPGERTRGQVFDDMFRKGMDAFLAQDLSTLGLTEAVNSVGYIGGISINDKATVNDDTDRVTNRFTRGKWDNNT